ncbi:hypothetical protein GDO81_017319 [Engystomops pustulosus]|uniref:Uncharacterized protein n=1 Tax=Engystomops pustulosus TaxID=76066 RepID=A0AAV7AJ08_ENGPU|nr:hypothetical protein GDO81_017319 [Engystomops pustulosus]
MGKDIKLMEKQKNTKHTQLFNTCSILGRNNSLVYHFFFVFPSHIQDMRKLQIWALLMDFATFSYFFTIMQERGAQFGRGWGHLIICLL